MDHNGDTRHYVLKQGGCERLFPRHNTLKELTSLGFTTAVRNASGDVTSPVFDPAAEETVFYRDLSAAHRTDMPAQLLISAAQYLRTASAGGLRKLMDLRDRYEAIARRREARGITLLREWLLFISERSSIVEILCGCRLQ